MREMRCGVTHGDRVGQTHVRQDLRLCGHRIGGRCALVELDIDHRAGDIFDRLEPHVIGRRRQQPVQQILGHRFARLGMGREFGQDLGHFQPVFIELAGQFHEIARHGRARDALICHVAQHLVERMAEFVKQRARIVIGQQRRLPRGRFGKVTDVMHDGTDIAAQLALAAAGRTPRPRPFRSTREIIAHEHGHMLAVAGHLIHADIWVIGGHVQRRELQPEQAVRAGKGGLDHAVQLQIGFQDGLVQVMLGLAAFFRIIPPIPRGQRFIHAVLCHQILQHLGIGQCGRLGRFPHPFQQGFHIRGRLGHFGLKLIRREIRVSQQGRALMAQGQDFGGDVAVVGFAPVGPPRGPCGKRLFAQIATRRELQKRHDQRPRQGQNGTVCALFLTRGAGPVPHEIGQTVKVLLGQRHEPTAFIRQQVLRELRAQNGQTRFHIGQAVTRVALQLRPLTDEPAMGQFQNLRLFVGQVQVRAPLPQGVDAREQGGIHRNLGRIGRQFRREFPLQAFAFRRAIRARDGIEHAQHPTKPVPRQLQRVDRVFKRRRVGLIGDGGDFGTRLINQDLERLFEISVGNVGIGGQVKRCRPVAKQRVSHQENSFVTLKLGCPVTKFQSPNARPRKRGNRRDV